MSDRLERMIHLLTYIHSRNETITYGEVGRIIGMFHRHVGPMLTKEVAPYCQENNLPDLWMVIVNKETGRPGRGAYTPHIQ